MEGTECSGKADIFSLGLMMLEIFHPFSTWMERSPPLLSFILSTRILLGPSLTPFAQIRHDAASPERTYAPETEGGVPRGKPTSPSLLSFSPPASWFQIAFVISRCLSPEPASRPSAAELLAMLDDFFPPTQAAPSTPILTPRVQVVPLTPMHAIHKTNTLIPTLLSAVH